MNHHAPSRRLPLWLLALLALCAGCQESHTEKTLGETEFYFEDCLSSLSADGDSALWIGSETGDLHYFGKSLRRTWNLGTERIYDVAAERHGAEETTLWIGIRNSGLQRWTVDLGTPSERVGRSLPQAGKSRRRAAYSIRRKGERYSAYDVLLADSSLFAATSNGLYVLPSRFSSDSLRLLYPAPDSPAMLRGAPFIVNNLCRCGNAVWAATQEGLLKVDAKTRRTTLLHKGENILGIETDGRQLYALSRNRFFIDGPDGTPRKESVLPFSARRHYRAGPVHYFLSFEHVFLTKDLKSFVSVPLRRGIPEASHQLMAFNAQEGFTYLLTKNALWRIPVHIGLFHNDSPVTAACASAGGIFYVNARKELFRQKAGETKAVKIYAFPPGEHISDIHASGRNLFYVDGHNRVKKLALRKRLLENEVFSRPRTLCDLSERITATGLFSGEQGDSLLVGVQDDVFSASPSAGLRKIPALSNKYVTAFRAAPGGKGIYVSTLNDGTFYGQDGRFERVEGTSGIPFLCDLCPTQGYPSRLVLLTSHALFLHGSPDTLRVKGMRKLLFVNDTLFYALPQFGLRKYAIEQGKIRCKGHYYKYMEFNPAACIAKDGRLYLGSRLGALVVAAGAEEKAQWVSFNSDVPGLRTVGLWLCALLLAVLAGFSFFLRWRQIEKRSIRLRLDDLKRRYAALNTICDRMDQREREAIRAIGERIAAASSQPATRKATNQQLSDISEEIMKRNREAALQLSHYLDLQAQKIRPLRACESDKMLEASRQARESDDIERIRQQVERNEAWLDSLKTVADGLKRIVVPDWAVITGVNDEFVRLHKAVTEENSYPTAAQLRHDYERMKQAYAQISTPEAMQKIRLHALDDRKRLERLANGGETAAALAEKIDDLLLRADELGGVQLLCELNRVDLRVKQMETKEQLRTTMEEYAALRATLVSENEKRVNRKPEKTLEADIASAAKPQTSRIEALISTFYACMDRTDHDALQQLLGFSSYTGQAPKIFCLLIAFPKVKRAFLAGMIGIYGNMNPVVSRLVSGRIRKNEAELREYVARHPCSLMADALKLL